MYETTSCVARCGFKFVMSSAVEYLNTCGIVKLCRPLAVTEVETPLELVVDVSIFVQPAKSPTASSRTNIFFT